MEPNDRPDAVDLTAEAEEPIVHAAPASASVTPDPVAPGPVAPAAGATDSVTPDSVAPDSAGPDAPATGEAHGQDIPEASDELEVLAAIEQDFAAVEEAMAGLDRVDAQELGGAAAAAQVDAIVGSGRFDVER